MMNNCDKIKVVNNMKKIKVNNNNYLLIKEEKESFDEKEFLEKCTDYFYEYDYIVGDYAYSKLRLKGFNKKTNKNFKKINDYNNIDKYIKENCAYNCKYYILEKENN